MQKLRLTICGKDKAYTKRLYEYLVSNYGNDVEISLYTDFLSFKESNTQNKTDAVLVEEGFMQEELEGIKNKLTITEDEKLLTKEGYVYKYLAADRIYKEIMAMCAAKEASDTEEFSKETKVIGVYSPVKRCFQTTFSITLGQILAKKKKTLYLNFECFSGFDALISNLGKTDICDLVYFSEVCDGNFSFRVESMKEKIGNLDYISPSKAYVKLSEVSKKQWKNLINNLCEKTDYEVIILDLSEQANGLLDILKRCDEIYTIVDDDRIALAKVSQYEALLKDSSYEEILTKTENVRIPKFKEVPNNLEMLPFSEFANFVGNLINLGESKENDGKLL